MVIGGDRSLFVSVQTYLLGKLLGIEQAGQEFSNQCAGKFRPGHPPMPVVKMVRRCQELGSVYVWHGWATELPKLRSRAAFAAWQRGDEFWIQIDDDVECDLPTLASLVELAAPNSISVLPCLIRGTKKESANVNCVFSSSVAWPVRGHIARKVIRGGTGLMVVSRGALMQLISAHKDDLAWMDDDGVEKVALFEQRRVGKHWYGEDYSFCQRATELGIDIWAPAEGLSVHDGRKLELPQITVE